MIKTFVTAEVEEMDIVVNEFEKEHKVFATQTNTVVLPDGKVLHKSTVFFKEDK